MRYLLDSTLLIDHANGDGPATTLIEQLFANAHELYTCDVVTCEVLSGGDETHRGHLRNLLDALEYVATTPKAAQWAGRSRLERRRAGGRRALADALIAGVAWQLDATIVTRNHVDFERQGVPVLVY